MRAAWFGVVAPCLVLNYFGQGAVLLYNPNAVQNPFFMLPPDWALYPMVILATVATVIASQATISGAFSITRQAIQLGFLPRMTIVQTSARERGQIYLPGVNWWLLAAVLAAVIGFGSSANLASAYGVAVSLGTTIIFLVLIQLTKAIGGSGIVRLELAAWLPSALFGVVGLILLARVRT